jgi:alkylation response protein AidB-like acyl-CoA dehydrogenase
MRDLAAVVPPRSSAEQQSRRAVEDAREREWTGRAFLREMFLGNLMMEAVQPFPAAPGNRPEFRRFFDELHVYLREHVDPVVIDETCEYPPGTIDGLRRLGAFGMRIPTLYGGLGFTVSEYTAVMQMVGSYDGNVAALLSAHQSIGVPRPLELFGTPEQKRRYLPACARGAISAFALTESESGSDPASLSTTAELQGDAYFLNGEKLWCTNGTLAELITVMARDPSTKKISCFVVETAWPGVKVERRCRFMGLKALASGVISFTNVRVPRENLVGGEGEGLKVALITLDIGRLTLPAITAGLAKRCLEICRGWAAERTQWGVPIWKHEAVAQVIGEIAATTYAMDAVSRLASAMADRGGYDIRLEAAAAKEWNTVRAWEIVDRTLQLRGGRGYETESSLAERNEFPVPVERLMRDCRINLIFEGSSEIMHLFMAREAVDKHLQVAGAMIDPENGASAGLRALPGVLGHYAVWYPRLWLRGVAARRRFGDWGELAPHVRFVDAACRRLARASFHGMALYRAQMERKQAFLFRCVDVLMELFAMAATLSRTKTLLDANDPEAPHAAELTELFCRMSRRKVDAVLRALWRNDDASRNAVAASVMQGDHAWLESGILDIGLARPEAFATVALTRSRRAHAAAPPVASS